MKIVLAPDKFKNSLTALEFCDAVASGFKTVLPHCDIVWLPLADGGDGTLEVVNYYLKGKTVKVTVNNPFFQPVEASYLYHETSKTAYIEMAEASGLKLLKPQQFDCKNATTQGTGTLILNAINNGAETIILGIGGSATNDCGIGMASALSYTFLDKKGKEILPTGANLKRIVSIDTSKVHPKLKNVEFKIACDVANPLYGKQGAAYVYASQKGATLEDIKMLDDGLKHFASLIEYVFGVNPQQINGAGAAGGMGIASKVFLNGNLIPGIQLLKDMADFDTVIADADWIITGEGKLDAQTLSGKTIKGVLNSAKAKHKNVAAFCGAIDLDKKSISDFGLNYTDAVMNYTKDLNDAMEYSYDYVQKMAIKFANSVL